MNNVNWGILGTAEIAEKLTIPAMQRAKNAKAYAIASRGGKAAGFSTRFKIPKTYGDYESLLNDPNVDAVYIPLPNHLHAQWVIEASKKGKHVLCEKPAALSAQDTKEMIKVCKENNVIFMETFMYQYHPQNQRVREVIASGEIGDVKFMRSNCSFYLDKREAQFRLNRAMGGGSLYDVGCYCIHSIRNILKLEPSSVYAKAHYHPEYHVDMSVSAILEFEKGIKAVFDCGIDMAQHMCYEIVGTKGVIQVPRAYRPDLYAGEGHVVITNEKGETREEIIPGDEYRLAIEHFSNCVIEEAPAFYSPENTVQNMKFIDACFESFSKGEEVSCNK